GDRSVVEAQALDDAGPKPFEEDIGALQQSPYDLLAGVGLEVDGDALLAEVADDRVGRVAAVARADRARPVAIADALDLDDVGAVLRQQHGAVGAGDALAEIDDLQAGKGRVIAHRLGSGVGSFSRYHAT